MKNKSMNKEKAQEILKDHIKEDGGLYSLGHYISWNAEDEHVTLDSEFTAEELEAIAWWMRSHMAKKETGFSRGDTVYHKWRGRGVFKHYHAGRETAYVLFDENPRGGRDGERVTESLLSRTPHKE